MSTTGPAGSSSFLPGPATSQPRSFGGLFGLAVRRNGGQRALGGVISVLVISALGMFAFPAITDVIGGHRQVVAINKFTQPGFKTVYRDGRVAVGDGLTKLTIDNPRVSVNVLVVEGTTVAALRAGAGHYEGTPYPCWQAGNVGIAGHRTTYGRPFNRLNYMRPGDTVKLQTPVSQCTYQVVPADQVAGESVSSVNPRISNPWFILPNDQSVVAPIATGHWLTLTSCNPPGSDSQRIVLRLKMISCSGQTCPQGGST